MVYVDAQKIGQTYGLHERTRLATLILDNWEQKELSALKENNNR